MSVHLNNKETSFSYLYSVIKGSIPTLYKRQSPASFPTFTNATLNYIDLGYVTPIKNQGACGSCWAFSTTGTLEGAYFRNTKTLISLSEQDLVDCVPVWSGVQDNCHGNWPWSALDYVYKSGGIVTGASYPYTSGKSANVSYKACYFNSLSPGNYKPIITTKGYAKIPKGNETALMSALVGSGPVSVVIYIPDDFLK